jgi:hypothetical protein
MLTPALTVRLVTLSDVAPSSRRPNRVLIAEDDGLAVAALSLTSGAVIGDDLPGAAAAVPLLRRIRYQLLRQGGRVARLSSLSARPFTAAPAGA